MNSEVRLYSSDTTNCYTYKSIVLTLKRILTLIDNIKNIHCEFNITMDKDNTFSKDQIETIFENIDFIIEIINKKLVKLFNNSTEIDDSFECVFDLKLKTLIILFDYQSNDDIDLYTNESIKTIVDTLIDSANELKKDNILSNLKFTS